MGCASSAETQGPSIHELYTFHKKLGQGAFGQVRACVRIDNREECAVKIIDVDGNLARRREARLEALIWKRLGSHQHVTSLLETFSEHAFSYFVMEKCDRSLCDMLLQKERLQELDVLDTFRQMLLGIEHCHSMGVVHRDVKPANFLVSSNGLVKLCDFGLAKLEDPQGLTGMAGTPPFMSPEMVLHQTYDCKTDIWSLGATAYLMLYGQYVYDIDKLRKLDPKMAKVSSAEVMQSAIATNRLPPAYEAKKGLPSPSSVARDFVQILLQRDPHQRLSARESLELASMRCQDATCSQCSVQAPTLASTIRLVKQTTADLKVPVDPTVGKTMDELIEQLQRRCRGEFRLPRSFSLPSPDEKPLECPGLGSRSITHGGEFSFGKLRMGDEMSESSTAASSSSTVSRKLSL